MLKSLFSKILTVSILTLSTTFIPTNAFASETQTNIISPIISVQVSGAVKKPGVYKVVYGSRISEVISKAGGLKNDAVTSDINFAGAMTDGQMIHIASKIEVQQEIKQGSTQASFTIKKDEVKKEHKKDKTEKKNKKDKKSKKKHKKEHSKDKKEKAKSSSLINLNTASEDELNALPGVGDKLVSSIIEYRKQNKGFKNVDELNEVEGIGDKKFKKLRSKITV